MAISFHDIPSNQRTPFVMAEFDAAAAGQGPALLSYKALMLGQKLSGGSGTEDTIVQVTGVEDVIDLAGEGSILHRMAIAWFAVNRSTPIHIGLLADDSGGTAATGEIAVTGTATEDGTIALYIGGVRITASVSSGDNATAIGDAIEAAINADASLLVTAANTTGNVALTFDHKGEIGNHYDVRDSYLEGEELPAGVSLAHTVPTSGATNPSLTNIIAAMADEWYNVIVHPYTDSTSMAAINAELADRFGPTRMIDGVAVTSVKGSNSTLTTYGDGFNSAHCVVMSQPGETPLTPPMEFAAEVGALIAYYGAIDPARPFQTLGLVNAVPPATADLFTLAERNLQLYDGIGTTRVSAGAVQLERPITTYQTNAAAADDDAYLDVTTMLTLMYLRYSFRNRIQTKYARHKLADDGTRFGKGQKVVTPEIFKLECLGWFRDMEELGLVEGFDQFKEDLVVERNGSDANRLDVLLPPDLINQLMVVGAQIQFRL